MNKRMFGAIFLFTNAITSCQKEGPFSGGNETMPASFHFVIANNQGQSLFSSTSDAIDLAFPENGQLINPGQRYHPFKATLPADPVDFICRDAYMANKSKTGTKTFYLTFRGKTDTLGLDIRRVPATPDNGGNSAPIVRLNGQPVQASPGTPDFPDYFVLKRR